MVGAPILGPPRPRITLSLRAIGPLTAFLPDWVVGPAPTAAAARGVSGISKTGPYAETIPPLGPYATRTPPNPKKAAKLSTDLLTTIGAGVGHDRGIPCGSTA